MGSAMSSGSGVTWAARSGFDLRSIVFRSIFDREEKNRGEKQVVGMAQEGWMQDDEVLWDGMEIGIVDFIRVGETEHRRERSKSESMMWPSSLTRTFSGLRSR